MHTPAAQRRRVKVHGASLGPLLCWSIVFADIGTSIYYVPGILSASGYNKRAAIFVLMTLVVFVLLALKYAQVTWRNPEGGGGVPVLHLVSSRSATTAWPRRARRSGL